MKTALVIVRPEQSAERLVREAGELAAGVGAELVVLGVGSESEYRTKQSALQSAGGGTLTIGQATDTAASKARRTARHALGDVDVAYTVQGIVSDETDLILDVAEDRGADHLFVGGRRRTPAGKALFGDLTQRLMLAFDGPVTVLLDGEQ